MDNTKKSTGKLVSLALASALASCAPMDPHQTRLAQERLMGIGFTGLGAHTGNAGMYAVGRALTYPGNTQTVNVTVYQGQNANENRKPVEGVDYVMAWSHESQCMKMVWIKKF